MFCPICDSCLQSVLYSSHSDLVCLACFTCKKFAYHKYEWREIKFIRCYIDKTIYKKIYGGDFHEPDWAKDHTHIHITTFKEFFNLVKMDFDFMNIPITISAYLINRLDV